MILKSCELINLMVSAVVGGMYWGPWLALSRSLNTFEPAVFLAITNRLNKNMASLMTYLTPMGLLSTLPTLYLSYYSHPITFYLTLVGFVFFLTAVVVTVWVEVPIVMQIIAWNVLSLPGNWQQLRDRWVSFHIIRVASSIIGLTFLMAGAIF